MNKLPTYFISHGGGPWPWIEGMVDGPYAKLAASLQNLPADIGTTPKAIVMVSAHWEESQFTVQASAKPAMIYDYYGFPEHTYKISYAAPGCPKLAAQVCQLIQSAGLAATQDFERGYDHGLYAPMQIAYPKQDMPILQLSLHNSLDPGLHLELGRALAPLREENVLLIGSGLSYHNLRAFGTKAQVISKPFDQWLNKIIQLDSNLRNQELINWEQAPNARLAHPREEHLLPLMFAVGAAETEPAKLIYHETDFMGGVAASSFRFG